MNLKLVEIQTFVSDLARAKRFYEVTLGFKVRQEGEAWVIFDLGNMEFVIQPGAQPDKKPIEYGKQCRTMMVLNSEDIESDYKQLTEKGVRFIGEIKTVPQGKYVAFLDPDENLIELVQQNRVL